MIDPEGRLAGLLAEIPGLEARARALQAKEGVAAEEDEVQALRDDYFRWYSQCLVVLPEAFQTRFRDMYEGGAFTKRIRHYLEAPSEPSPFQPTSPDSPRSSLLPYWAYPFETTFRPSFLSQRQILADRKSVV